MRSIALSLAVFGLSTTPAFAQQAPEIKEWNIDNGVRTQTRDPFVDAQGRVWFVGQRGHYAAYLDPKTGAVKKFDLDPGTGPHNLIVAPNGIVWYAGNAARPGHIGKLDPETGKIVKYLMPDSAARDPHTLIFDKAGDIWFSVQGGNFIGKLTTATGDVRLIASKTPRSRPYGIKLDSKGNVWCVLFGTNKVATVDAKTFELREYDIPRASARPRRIEITPDDMIWYGDHQDGFLGRLDPTTGEIREWPMPSGSGSRPYGMASDELGRVWVVETGVMPNRFVGFDSKTLKFLPGTDLPSGGAVRHMFYDQRTKTVWFGVDTGFIGAAKLPPAIVIP